MDSFSALLAFCAGNSPVTGELPAQRPVTQSFDVFFDLRLNKRLNKQSWGWWSETPSSSLWRHCNVLVWSFACIPPTSWTDSLTQRERPIREQARPICKSGLSKNRTSFQCVWYPCNYFFLTVVKIWFEHAKTRVIWNRRLGDIFDSLNGVL